MLIPNNRLEQEEESISKTKGKSLEIPQWNKNKKEKKNRKIENSVWDLWNTIKWPKLGILEVSESVERACIRRKELSAK